jgi:hypothetical protein
VAEHGPSEKAITGELFDPFRERHERAERGRCAECGKRRGYKTWGDALAMTHGGGELRCGVCVYGPQLRHALGRATRIPVLASKLFWAFLTESSSPDREGAE